MADPLPPDPYSALGVAKDATATAIKTQYRKLVLKCHPDKVKDEAEKQDASDKFHKIQSAWEIIGDDAKRARYDAQAKLQELRKDVFGHGGEGRRGGGGGDVRTASYKFPTESPRGGDFYTRGPDRYGPKMSPQYEERMPSYAEESYFDERPPRPAARKYDEYDRSSKRAQPREERERPRAKESKENDRSSRKEKSRRTDKDVRRDRDRKQAYVEVVDEYESDEYPRARRSSAEDENLERAREKFWSAPDPYAREAADDRARRTFDKLEEAKAHMERSRGVNRQRGESEPRDPSPPARRPSPVRMSSSKDKVERTKRADVRPSLFGIRHGSGDRPKLSTRNTGTGKNAKSDNEKKSSDEERRNSRRKEETRDSKPPNLSKSKSQPPDVRPPFQRQRSHSMQDEQHTEEPIPQIRRSDTTPLSPTAGVPPSRETRRRANDRLHPQDAAYPTPDPTPEPEPQKFRYGREQTYADDGEFATPDGYVNPTAEPYRTQVYEPTPREPPRQSTRESARNPRITRSPSPMKDTDRQGRRSSSARHTPAQKPPMPRTTSTQYVVDPDGAYARPAVSRENSGRAGLSRENSGHKGLYGEIPRATAVRSGSPRASYAFPPPEEVQYSRRYEKGDFKVQAGYSRREPEKAGYTRTGSGLQRQAVYA